MKFYGIYKVKNQSRPKKKRLTLVFANYTFQKKIILFIFALILKSDLWNLILM